MTAMLHEPIASHSRHLGAQLEDGCFHFALAAPHATAVELCVFDAVGRTEIGRWRMPLQQDGVWRGALPCSDQQHDAALQGRGLIYGWRVHGPWAPQEGHRFNPAKLLLDPYAREVVGRYDGDNIHLGHDPGDATASQRADPRDNAATALKARVVAGLPAPRVARPRINAAQRVIYELHVKGFSALHPDLPTELRGTYAGLAHPACVRHLRQLGVTTVCLLPVAFRADEARLQAAGLSNYWGYSPIAWSAPEPRYWSGQAGSHGVRAEFRAMVDALHAEGIEVVLDVVYNHSAETDQFGPTLSLRGIDNALYYRLLPDDRSGYVNWTGCGNCLNLNEPLVLRMVMDSLRLWVTEYGVDGFRFDLATTLARGNADVQGAFQRQAPWLSAIAQDPVLNERLMIAEPWDIGPGGYQLGGFPPGWLEWNDRFRDTQRAFWLHGQGTRGSLAGRLAGSSDVFSPVRRAASSSVNYITAHDGFTLRDLLSYSRRHNGANGEENRDGHAHSLSINNGVEGDTDRPDVLALRARKSRALLATLCLSLGTPMLLGGDEIGHTQRGNNNAYCQDNVISWLDWHRVDQELLGFVRQVLALRRACPLLQSRAWWHSAVSEKGPLAQWFNVQGEPMTNPDWHQGDANTLALKLQCAEGQQAALMLINAGAAIADFALPAGSWCLRLDSAVSAAADQTIPRMLSTHERLPATSLWVALQGNLSNHTREPL